MTLTVDQSRALLQRTGLRRTTSRVAVLQYLAASPRPMTHLEASTELVPRGFDKSTIYRALVEMAEAGILSRLDLGDHIWRFELRSAELAGDGAEPGSSGLRKLDHPHFMCLDCGKVTCLPQSSVQVTHQDRGQVPSPGEVTEVLLKGRCRECV